MIVAGRDVGWPICAKCNARCDQVETQADLVRGGIIFRVYHHGAVEEIKINEDIMLVSFTFVFGKAFVQTELAPAH